MKVLFVTNGYPTKRNPEFCVFTKEQVESVLNTKKIEGEVFFINAKEKGIFEYIRAIVPLRKKMKYYDIIHVFHGLSLILVFLLSPKKKIIVSFLHSIENEYREKKLTSNLLSNLTKRIIQKQNITKIFKDKIPAEYSINSYYLPNGVDTNKFYPIFKSEAKKYLNLDSNKKYILFVSSKNKYRKQKRYDRFQEVIEILRKDYPYIEELVLVNEPRDKIVYYFNAAELHLLTSDFEGSPNSVKESIACNTPVVATNTGNVFEMIGDIEDCFVSNTFETKELVKYCCCILANSDKKFQINQHIHQKGLDIQSKTAELLNIYKTVYEQRI